MDRYCVFTEPANYDRVAKMYGEVTADIEFGDNEIYVTVQSDNEIITALVGQIHEKLKSDPDITRVMYAPVWHTLYHNNGPFFMDDLYTYLSSHVVNKSTGEIKYLTVEEELPLATLLVSGVPLTVPVINNFWSYYGILMSDFAGNFHDIDYSDLVSKLETACDNPYIVDKKVYGSVIVDGDAYTLDGYKIPPSHVTSEGFFVQVRKSDVLLNSSERVDGFTTKLVQGAGWSARYRDPENNRYRYVFINFVKHGAFEDEDAETVSESSDGSFDFWDDLIDDEIFEFIKREPHEDLVKILKADPVKHEIDFTKLTDTERYLPASYIIPDIEQWEILLKCVLSKFTYVKNIHKISDRNMYHFVNLVKYAMNRGFPEYGKYLIDYYESRLA